MADPTFPEKTDPSVYNLALLILKSIPPVFGGVRLKRTTGVSLTGIFNHEKEVDYTLSDDKDYSNLYFLAEGFDAFLNSLKED